MTRARSARRILALVHPSPDAAVRPRVCYRMRAGAALADRVAADLAASLACKRDAACADGCVTASLRYGPRDAAHVLARMARRWRRWGVRGRWCGPRPGGG